MEKVKEQTTSPDGANGQSGQPTGEQMLTKADVARYCQVTSRCIDNWMARGILAYFKMGRTVRFRLGDVQDHLTKNCRVCRRTG